MSSVKQITSKLARKSPKTASELGTTALFLGALESANIVQRVGTRRTEKRGRPAIEWALGENANQV